MGWRSVILAVVFACLGLLVQQERAALVTVLRVVRLMSSVNPKPAMKELVQALPADRRVVILSIQAKMGTTWVGHLTHQILVRGAAVNASRNLQEDLPYAEFAPFIFGRRLHKLGPPAYWDRELFSSHPATPVVIRSHANRAELESVQATEKQGFRLVTMFRDPYDTVLSAMRFFPRVVGVDVAKVNPLTFFRALQLLGKWRAMFQDYVDHWEKRHEPGVLLLFFSDLKTDLQGSVRRLAKHLRVEPELADSTVARIAAQSSKDVMSSLKMETRFNDFPKQFKKWIEETITGSEPRIELVRKDGGKVGEGQEVLPEKVRELIASYWDMYVLARTNCTSVEDMRIRYRAELVARGIDP